jgi:hypothetical protein
LSSKVSAEKQRYNNKYQYQSSLLHEGMVSANLVKNGEARAKAKVGGQGSRVEGPGKKKGLELLQSL